jgi:hypothetical protein
MVDLAGFKNSRMAELVEPPDIGASEFALYQVFSDAVPHGSTLLA